MYNRFLLFLIPVLFMFVSGCGDQGGAVNNIHGQWVCDADATFEKNVDMEKADEDLGGFSRAVLRGFTLDIDGPAKKISINSEKFNKGMEDFTVVSDSGSKLIIQADQTILHIDILEDGRLSIYDEVSPDSILIFKKK